MKHTTAHRIFALLLALALCGGFLPRAAQAAEAEPQFAKVSYYSKLSNAYVGDGCYWDDGWFLADAAERNDGLALLSAQLSAAAADASGGAAFLTALGFAAESRRFDSEEPDDCGYTLGVKTVDGRAVVAVVFQGDLYGAKGWQQNVTVNGDEPTADQASFAAAARAFLADLDAMGFDGDAVVWLTGQSRAGAVANLAAAYLLERDEHPTVLAYTLEAPATTESPDAHGDAYRSIHNYICDDDPVVMLPIWGMTRYGQEHVYNHAATVEDTLAALLRQNPDAAETAETYVPDVFEDDGGVRGYLEWLLGQLALSLPDRASYSAPNAAVVPEVGTITYAYQDGLRALCRVAFGDGVDAAGLKDKLSGLTDYLGELAYACMEEAYAVSRADDALLPDAAARRWAVADAVYASLDEASLVGVAREDLYALLRLLSPLVTDLSPLADEGFVMPAREGFEDLGYVDWTPIFRLGGSGGTLLFSHHPDVVLARLKLLAPQPDLDDAALTIDEPKAGDALTVTLNGAPEEAWLTVREAAWLESEGETARAGWTYYLRLTLAAVGHTVPDDFAFTLNDRAPIEYAVTYADGEALVTGVWDFTVGEAEQVDVTFDANGHGDAPETQHANAGALLRHTGLTPAALGTVKDDTGLWRFDGWYDANGAAWTDVSVGGGVTLTARWTRLVGDIALSYAIPRVGDTDAALTKVSAPDGALYDVAEVHLTDESWNEVERVESTGEHNLTIFIKLYDKDVAFQSEPDEYGGLLYAGTLTLNGESISGLMVESERDWETGELLYDYISLSYDFHPLPRKTSGGGGSSGGGSSSQETTQTQPAVIEPAKPTFADVPEGAWYADAVAWAAKTGVTTGTDETHFSPSAPCTRAQTAVFLWRAAGSPEPSGAALTFGDVPRGAYYEKAVRWAAEQGIVRGVDAASFAPNAPCTRAQCAAFLYRFAKAGATTGRAFADVPDSAWYAAAVAWAAATGVTTGTDSTHFSPDAACTRAHIVTFLFRHMGGAA